MAGGATLLLRAWLLETPGGATRPGQRRALEEVCVDAQKDGTAKARRSHDRQRLRVLRRERGRGVRRQPARGQLRSLQRVRESL
jgi:hypothetical protein